MFICKPGTVRQPGSGRRHPAPAQPTRWPSCTEHTSFAAPPGESQARSPSAVLSSRANRSPPPRSDHRRGRGRHRRARASDPGAGRSHPGSRPRRRAADTRGAARSWRDRTRRVRGAPPRSEFLTPCCMRPLRPPSQRCTGQATPTPPPRGDERAPGRPVRQPSTFGVAPSSANPADRPACRTSGMPDRSAHRRSRRDPPRRPAPSVSRRTPPGPPPPACRPCSARA